MKVLILSNNLSGLFCFRYEVMKALKEEGNELVISVPFDDTKDHFSQLGCELIDTNFNRKGLNPLKDVMLILRYCRLIRQINPDVVLSYTIKPNLYGGIACQFNSIPQIANITGLGTAVENPGWLQKITIFLYKIGLRKAHTVFFQNKSNLEFCVSHNMVKKSDKILIPGSGVNLQRHSFQPLPFQNDPIRFIFISRIIREKGIDEFLSAGEEIKRMYPNTEFHVLGYCEEDNYQKRIKSLQQEGIIFYHGSQPDVRPFIGKCHCLVHPSFYPEGMSNVLLEACAAGRPIVTTNRPGCGEIVEDGVNGYLVKQRDVDDLINKLELFVSLPYQRKCEMGLAARRKVEREFDRQIVVDAYLKVIDEISNIKDN